MSTQVDQQPQDDSRPLGAAEPGSEDEAIEAFNRRLQSEAQTEQDPPADDPDEGATDPEADPEEGEAEPEAADPAGDLVEVEFEGETFEVPPKLKDALLRKADYSRAEAKKDYAQRIESATKLIEGAEKYAEAIAEGKQLEAQIKQFKAVDWKSLRSTDPAQAALMAVELMELRQARVQIDSKAEAINREIADGRSKDQQAKQAEMLKVLAKEFPGWGEEAGSWSRTTPSKRVYGEEIATSPTPG
jgi:hypothetical protein